MDSTQRSTIPDVQGTSVGLLAVGTPSPAQTSLSQWLDDHVDVNVLPVEDIGSGEVSLERFDTLWWHHESLLDSDRTVDLATIADPLDSYLDDGGGLLLSRGALQAVGELEIERDPPDRAVDSLSTDTDEGLLIHPLYEDLPVFDGFDTLRVETGSSDGAAVWYEDRTPRDGDVIASRFVDDRDLPGANAAVYWQHGDGAVLGVGAGLSADGDAGTSRRLAINALSYLAADDREAPSFAGRPKDGEAFGAMRERELEPQHRPIYHFTPPANWLNDPNGLVHWNGTYHLFYQYNPAGPYHDSIHWGHATSEDLVTWEDRPIALTPEPDSPDENGCWSGCFVDDDGTPTLVYTGNRDREQLPCLATTDDPSLENWEKSPANPVVDAPPSELDLCSSFDSRVEFRDHNVWREGDTWYQIIGSGIEDVGGTALLYESADLREWEYCHPILTGDLHRTGTVWECPELLQFEDRSVLHVSDYRTVKYFLGSFDQSSRRFEPETCQHLDRGVFYAPQSFEDEDGRTVTFGWLKEDREVSEQWDAGWSGAMSLPRVLSVEDGTLSVEPAAEVHSHRGTHHEFADVAVEPGESGNLPGVSGDALEIRAVFEASNAQEFGLALRATPDDEERTELRYTPKDRWLTVDRADASLNEHVDDTPHGMPVSLTDDGLLRLHVFLDRSVLEIFGTDGQTLSSRIYPTRSDSVGVDLFAREQSVTVESIDIWEMESSVD